jgi:hypothetical protein
MGVTTGNSGKREMLYLRNKKRLTVYLVYSEKHSNSNTSSSKIKVFRSVEVLISLRGAWACEG